MKIESRLTEWMDLKELSIYKLSKRSKLSKETISRARDNRIESCTLKSLGKIAKSLGLKISDLYSEKD